MTDQPDAHDTPVDLATPMPATRSRLTVWGATAGTGLIVIAVVVTASLVQSAPTSSPNPGRSAASMTTAKAGEGPNEFDPMVRYARFGWLPGGAVQRTTVVQAGHDGRFIIEAGLPTRSIGISVIAVLFPRGVQPRGNCLTDPGGTRRGPSTAPATAAPPVNGKPAQWIADGDSVGRLRWEYAVGAWAEISGKDLATSDSAPAGKKDTVKESRTALHRVASDIRLGGTERLRFPLAVTDLPTNLRLVMASVTERSKAAWSTTLILSTGNHCPEPDGNLPGSLAIRGEAIIPGYGWGGGQSNTTVDGHLAFRQTSPSGGEGLTVFDAPGPHITLISGDATTTMQLGPDGLAGLYRRITVLGTLPEVSGEQLDLTNWTENPIR